MQPKEFFGWLCKSQQDATFCLFLIRNLFFLRDKNLSHSQSLIKNTYFQKRKHRVKEKKTRHLIQYSVIQFFLKGYFLPLKKVKFIYYLYIYIYNIIIKIHYKITNPFLPGFQPLCPCKGLK